MAFREDLQWFDEDAVSVDDDLEFPDLDNIDLDAQLLDINERVWLTGNYSYREIPHYEEMRIMSERRSRMEMFFSTEEYRNNTDNIFNKMYYSNSLINGNFFNSLDDLPDLLTDYISSYLFKTDLIDFIRFYKDDNTKCMIRKLGEDVVAEILQYNMKCYHYLLVFLHSHSHTDIYTDPNYMKYFVQQIFFENRGSIYFRNIQDILINKYRVPILYFDTLAVSLTVNRGSPFVLMIKRDGMMHLIDKRFCRKLTKRAYYSIDYDYSPAYSNIWLEMMLHIKLHSLKKRFSSKFEENLDEYSELKIAKISKKINDSKVDCKFIMNGFFIDNEKFRESKDTIKEELIEIIKNEEPFKKESIDRWFYKSYNIFPIYYPNPRFLLESFGLSYYTSSVNTRRIYSSANKILKGEKVVHRNTKKNLKKLDDILINILKLSSINLNYVSKKIEHSDFVEEVEIVKVGEKAVKTILKEEVVIERNELVTVPVEESEILERIENLKANIAAEEKKMEEHPEDFDTEWPYKLGRYHMALVKKSMNMSLEPGEDEYPKIDSSCSFKINNYKKDVKKYENSIKKGKTITKSIYVPVKVTKVIEKEKIEMEPIYECKSKSKKIVIKDTEAFLDEVTSEIIDLDILREHVYKQTFPNFYRVLYNQYLDDVPKALVKSIKKSRETDKKRKNTDKSKKTPVMISKKYDNIVNLINCRQREIRNKQLETESDFKNYTKNKVLEKRKKAAAKELILNVVDQYNNRRNPRDLYKKEVNYLSTKIGRYILAIIFSNGKQSMSEIYKSNFNRRETTIKYINDPGWLDKHKENISKLISL